MSFKWDMYNIFFKKTSYSNSCIPGLDVMVMENMHLEDAAYI